MAFGDYDFNLTANQSQQIAATGAVLRVRSCTGPIRIKIDGGPGIKLNAGQGFRMANGGSFRDITVLDVSGAGNTGVIFIGDAEFEDQTLFGAVSITGTVMLANQQGAFTQTTPAVTNADSQLLAANAARRYFYIQNLDAVANVFLRFDGAAATLANGVKLPPGGYMELQGYVPTGAVHIIADQLTADVRVLEG
jgi:hypothetical protein